MKRNPRRVRPTVGKRSAGTGQVVERGPGKFLVRVYAGSTPEGKNKYVSKTVRGTRKDAEVALAALLTDVERGDVLASPNMTVAEYLTAYLESKTNIRPGTRLDYRTRIERDIVPHLGRLKLEKLTPIHVSQWVATLSKTQAPRTVRYSYTLLAGAMKQAVLWDMLPKSPCRGIKLPAMEPTKVEVLDPAEVKALLSKSQGRSEYPMWVFALGTAMRPEEFLGLQWANVDLAAGTVRVETALNRQEDGSYAMGTPKTRASRRTIHLDAFTLGVLKEHRKTQAAAILQAGEDYDRTLRLVFANQSGAPLHIANVRASWYRAVKRAGLRKVKLYATRHTHASRLIASGAHVKAVAERLGHANPEITLTTYVHTTAEIHVGTAAMVAGAIFGEVAVAGA